jgi:hypothetical protein
MGSVGNPLCFIIFYGGRHLDLNWLAISQLISERMTFNPLPPLRQQGVGELLDLTVRLTKWIRLKMLPKYGWLFICGGIIFSLLAIQPSQAAGPPLLIDDYWWRLQETKDLVSSLSDASPEDQTIQLSVEADRWAEVREVILADGTVIPVDHSFLVSQLRADPPDLERLMGLLTTLLAARDAGEPARLGGAEMTKLADILAREEFQWAEEDSRPSWLEQLWRRFQAWLRRLLPDDGPLAEGDSFLSYLLTALGTLILVLTLGYIVRSLAINFVSETAIAGDGADGREFLTAVSALKQAQTLSEAGDYRAAVRYLYLSALLSLEERGLLRYNRSLTNREYLRSVAHLPGLAIVLRDVVDVFDRVWYGYQPLDQVTYQQYEARVAELHQPRLGQVKPGGQR